MKSQVAGSHTPQSLRDSSSILEEQLKCGRSASVILTPAGGASSALGVYERDMSANPDLVPTLAVTLCLLRVPFRLTGVATLRLKESDRLEALREELCKLGYRIEVGASTMNYDGNREARDDEVMLDSHGDHRIAMAMSLAATRHKIVIKNAEVVSKSYPDWWEQLVNA